MTIFLPTLESSMMEPTYEGFIEGGESGATQIIQESTVEAARLATAATTMDAINYSLVMEGAQSIITEATGQSVFTRVVEALKKLWAKLKAWFEQTKAKLASVFANGEEFVKKYERDLLKVDTQGFTYEGFIYDVPAGQTFIEKLSGDVDKEIQTARSLYLNVKQKEKIEHTTDYIKDTFFKNLGYEDTSEVLKELTNKLQGGEDPDEIENLPVTTVKEMIIFIKDKDKTLKAFDKELKEINKTLKSTIKDIEDKGKEKDLEEEESKFLQTTIPQLNSIVSTATSVKTAAYGRMSKVVGDAARSYGKTLKSLYRHKPTTEGFSLGVTESVSGDDAFSKIFNSL